MSTTHSNFGIKEGIDNTPRKQTLNWVCPRKIEYMVTYYLMIPSEKAPWFELKAGLITE